MLTRHRRTRGQLSWGGGQRRSPISGRLIIAAIVAIVSIVSYYSKSVYNPVTGEKQHIDMTVNQEIAIGLQSAPEMAKEYGGVSSDPEATALVNEVGSELASKSDAEKTPYKYEYHLLADEKTINAFALPGGQIFITEALRKRLTTRGQLAGVLGHETGHVVARHSAEQIAKAQLTQGLTGAAVIASYDPNNPRSRETAAVAMLIGQLVNMKFSRSDESQADQLGVRFMAQAGYDPRAMIGVMEILEKASQGSQVPEFFSTHPNPGNRIEKIKEDIKQEFPNGVPEGLTP